jgi:hypothetical protein
MMPADRPKTLKSMKVRKDMLNLAFFIFSIACVVVLLIHGKQAGSMAIASTIVLFYALFKNSF